MDRPVAATGGWHWAAWGSEFIGTAVLLAGGLSGLFLDFAPGSFLARTVPGTSARLLITGLILAATGLVVTFSPLGRRSGAHLNPSVTIAFWQRGHMHPHDLAGYVAAQLTGAIAGTAVAAWLWGARAGALHLGTTRPEPGITDMRAAAIEAGMTFVLVGGILLALSSARSAKWAPLAAWTIVALLVWLGGAWTGASLNPARSVAPALLSAHVDGLWVYMVGPVVGSVLAASVFGLVPGLRTVTAKLYHDPKYPSTMASTLPARATDSPLPQSRGRIGRWPVMFRAFARYPS